MRLFGFGKKDDAFSDEHALLTECEKIFGLLVASYNIGVETLPRDFPEVALPYVDGNGKQVVEFTDKLREKLHSSRTFAEDLKQRAWAARSHLEQNPSPDAKQFLPTVQTQLDNGQLFEERINQTLTIIDELPKSGHFTPLQPIPVAEANSPEHMQVRNAGWSGQMSYPTDVRSSENVRRLLNQIRVGIVELLKAIRAVEDVEKNFEYAEQLAQSA